MINHIHERLVTWASAALSDTLGALSYSSIQIDPDLDCAPDYDAVSLWSPAVEEIERAVIGLDDDLRNTIKAIYLEPDATMVQSAKRCRCDVRTLRRRRNAAHKQIDIFLTANKSFLSTLENKCCKRVRFMENAT